MGNNIHQQSKHQQPEKCLGSIHKRDIYLQLKCPASSAEELGRKMQPNAAQKIKLTKQAIFVSKFTVEWSKIFSIIQRCPGAVWPVQPVFMYGDKAGSPLLIYSATAGSPRLNKPALTEQLRDSVCFLSLVD